ncbi:MAG: thioredoxin family protein [Bacteroidetes bacterium]|nr:thioredoxin family protein [Bacteroidota bacterium]
MMTVETLKALPHRHEALLIYFYHDQCAPCLSLRPKVKSLVEERFPKIALEFVDALAYPELPASMGVFGFPTLILFLEGAEFGRWSKFVSVAQLEEQIERPYQLLFG